MLVTEQACLTIIGPNGERIQTGSVHAVLKAPKQVRRQDTTAAEKGEERIDLHANVHEDASLAELLPILTIKSSRLCRTEAQILPNISNRIIGEPLNKHTNHRLVSHMVTIARNYKKLFIENFLSSEEKLESY